MTCADAWMQLPNLRRVDADELQRLEADTAGEIAAARRQGHRHIVATRLAVAGVPKKKRRVQ